MHRRYVPGILAALLLAVGGLAWAADEPTLAQDGTQLTVTVDVYSPHIATPEGGECLGLNLAMLDPTLGTRPFPQAVVHDAAGVTVGVMDLNVGTTVTGGVQPLCRFSGAVAIPEAAFYDVRIGTAYAYTVPRQTLGDAGWTLTIQITPVVNG